MISWCCMRLNQLLGSARGSPGSTCISRMWLERRNTLLPFVQGLGCVPLSAGTLQGRPV